MILVGFPDCLEENAEGLISCLAEVVTKGVDFSRSGPTTLMDDH